jgi:deazaflavin-dependent oxidoreductase (nitroreductase family)
MSERSNWNERVIEEFRANGGNVEQFKGVPLLLLHHKGAKSGRDYINPLAFLPDDGRWVVFGSKGGAPGNPDWYFNLKANPGVKVELGSGEIIDATASFAEGAEHERLYNAQVARVPVFDDYRKRTSRVIPVVVLTRR